MPVCDDEHTCVEGMVEAMEIGLGWLGLAVGVVGFAAAYISARSEAPQEKPASEEVSPWATALLAAIITIALGAVAMLRQPPFSTGQSLGYGVLIGGLVGTAAILACARLSGTITRTRQLAALCVCFSGLIAASVAYVLFSGNSEWAMLGVGAGAVLCGILGLAFGSGSTESRLSGIFCVYTLTTSAAVIFAVHHFSQAALRFWWPIPILLGATIGLAAFVGIAVGALTGGQDKPGRSSALSALVASLVVIGLSAIYAWRIVHQWQLLWVVAAGIGAAAIVAWVASSCARTEDKALAKQMAAACAVLAIALVVVSFKLWAGFGIAIGLLSVWAVLIPLYGLAKDQESSKLSGAAVNAVGGLAYLVASVLLFRLFLELYRSDLGGSDLRIHYTFIGAILGVLTPGILSIRPLRETGGPWSKTLGIAFVGLVAAAAPVALLLVWEIKAVMGFVFGLTAALALCYADSLDNARRMQVEASLALGSALAAVVFVNPLLQFEMTRGSRIVVLGAVLVVTIAWVLVSGALSGRKAQ